MFAKSKFVRLALVGACLAATWLPIGNGLLQPAQANAAEFVRVGPIVRGGPIVRDPIIVRTGPIVGGPIIRDPIIVRTGPIVRDPIVRVGPVYPQPWHGVRWFR
jgi:hypothetical protein